MEPLILFGPQRLAPSLRPELDRLGIDGPVVSITAGWQEREGEIGELRDHVERDVIDLQLHGQWEAVGADDPELFAAHRERQETLRQMQRLYEYRLDFALEPARELLRRTGSFGLIEPERESAIDAVRRLDRRHLARVKAVHTAFERRWRPAERSAVARRRAVLAEQIEAAGAVLISGGHVAVLANRLRLFDLAPLLSERPVLAWSAGAMALGERIVLFHDMPPQGAGNAEVLDTGLGLVRGVLPLPHARHRLRLEDPVRVALFARRFAPDLCIPLDERMGLERTADGFAPLHDAYRLTEGGEVMLLDAA